MQTPGMTHATQCTLASLDMIDMLIVMTFETVCDLTCLRTQCNSIDESFKSRVIQKVYGALNLDADSGRLTAIIAGLLRQGSASCQRACVW